MVAIYLILITIWVVAKTAEYNRKQPRKTFDEFMQGK